MSDEYPRLRPVEAFPVDHEGAKLLALRDPAGYTSSVLMVPFGLVPLLALFDGQHSVVDIQAEIMRRQQGELVPRDKIEEVIGTLDEHGFMESSTFAERRTSIDQAFLASPVRAAAHAGGAYPGDAEGVRKAFAGFFKRPAGPGPIAADGTAKTGAEVPSAEVPRAEVPRAEVPRAEVRGIIAPHIDFHRGGPAYAWAYREMAERCSADLFVIFGTCHTGMAEPFALTRKDWQTPIGDVRVDQPFVETLAARSGVSCFASELAHRTEHSIEFQAVFLQYLFGGRRDFTIVPVLTSFAHEALATGQTPAADSRVQQFLEALMETAATSGRRVACVAGADLAHVGPRFGDPDPISAEELARVGREDREMLREVERGDPEGFFASVAADRDRRRICGLSPIYALLHVLDGQPGGLRHYGQWPDPQAVVTYASVVF
jgi:hypothetical protein